MGFDKALDLRDKSGRSLLAGLAEELGGRFGEVVLITDDPGKFSGRAELAAFRRERDLQPRSGPSGGIYTALKKIPGRSLFVMACDMPYIDWGLIERMAALMADGCADAAVPRHEEHCEPLYAFYGPRAEGVFQTSLAAGRLAVRDSLDLLKTVYLELTVNELKSGVFKNMNTTDDLRREGLPLPSDKVER